MSISRALLLSLLLSFALTTFAETHNYAFTVQEQAANRLCKNHRIVNVNGQFPGPTVEVQNGDSVAVKVTNASPYNVTIHWHGLRQLRNPWADGTEFVTQCPIRPGGSYTYKFTIQDQEGTLWWHAHSRWLRATVYGALVIRPKPGSSYPFPTPKVEFPVIL
ncbi:laccase 3, partial [Tanacetum coccineum]